MPRVDAGAEAGLRVPGAYEALLYRECERNERADQIAADMMARDGCRFRRDRRLSEALESGESVVVRRVTVESALWFRDRPPRRVKLPFDRAVRFVQVSPDDRIVLAADLEWDGAVAEGTLMPR